MSIDPKPQDQSAQGVDPEATTPDLSRTEPQSSGSQPASANSTTEAETRVYNPGALPGKPAELEETLQHVSRAPITGMPAGEETSAYDPPLSRGMANLDETLLQQTGRPIGETETEFTVGAGGGPCRYILKKFHAKGGMGEIWLADDVHVGRSVALKRMRSGREGNREKFFMEARITGRLEHPGIVPVHELGEDEKGQPFYIMKFVHGPTLKDAVKDYHDKSTTSSTPREVKQLRLLENFVSLCQTVAYAHSKGIIHRDIKPDNVMLGEYGETLVLDWGIAKQLGQAEGPENSLSGGYFGASGESQETEMGTIKGTPSYFAPEMAEGLISEIDQKSDVYLLGATLYQILTGQRPRKGDSVHQIIALARSESPPPPRTLEQTIPRALEAICLKAMARNKDDRYADALKLAEDVQRYLAGEPVSAYREPLLARAWRWARKHRRVLGQAAAVLLVVGITSFAYAQIREARRHAEEARLQAKHLAEEKLAREQVQEYRGLADEARFYLANLSPVSENAPYYEMDKGEKAGQAALAIADQWGANLEGLPLPELRAPLKAELYDLLLLLVGAQSLQANTAGPVPAMMSVLDRAASLSEPSRGYYRLRAACYRLDGKAQEAAQAQQQADDPQLRMTALDHFLLGEQYRTDAASQKNAPAKPSGWEPNRDLLVKAMAEYRLALKEEPEHYWAHYQLGRLYLGLSQWNEALEALNACIALRPKSPWAYTSRANVLSQLKRFDEAEADLTKVLADYPDMRPALVARGSLYWTKVKEKKAAAEKHGKALTEFEKAALVESEKKALADFAAATQPPDDKRLLEADFYRALLYLQRGEEGDLQKALEDLNRVAKEKPDFYRLYYFRALVNLILGQDAQVLEDLSIYLGKGKPIDNHNAEAYAQRGHLLRFLIPDLKRLLTREALASKWALAARDLYKATSLGGKSHQLFDDFGAVLESMGQLPVAIQSYGKALDLDPTNPKTLTKRGWARAARKDYDNARADFALVVKDHPDHAEAHAGLGYVAACQSRQNEAMREANLALLFGAGDFLILHNVACVYAELSEADPQKEKQFQDLAMDQLRRAVELWGREESTLDEVDLIRREPAFRPSMHARPDFRRLIRPQDLQGE